MNYDQNIKAIKLIIVNAVMTSKPGVNDIGIIQMCLNQYLVNKYGIDNINSDAVDLGYKIKPTDFTSKLTTEEINLVYGNLYTFVLVAGLCIPYCDWIYETEYVDKRTGTIFKQTYANKRKKGYTIVSNGIDAVAEIEKILTKEVDTLSVGSAADKKRRAEIAKKWEESGILDKLKYKD